MTADDRVLKWKPEFTAEPQVPSFDLSGLRQHDTTDALDRAAQALYEDVFPPSVTTDDSADLWFTWEQLPDQDRRPYRRQAAAVLRVMADDIRAEHNQQNCHANHHPDEQCYGKWCDTCERPWPCPTVQVLDAYAGLPVARQDG